jgi:hypothetical protein
MLVSTMPMFLLLSAALAAPVRTPGSTAPPYLVVRPGTEAESRYLLADSSVLREIGYDPAFPFRRIADMGMSFTYRLPIPPGHACFALLRVYTQFHIELAPATGGPWRTVSTLYDHERVGTLVLLDLTAPDPAQDHVCIRFTDHCPEDGWGTLLAELSLFDAGPGTRLVTTDLVCTTGEEPYTTGTLVRAHAPQRFRVVTPEPEALPADARALYVPMTHGRLARVDVGGRSIEPLLTWDRGWCIPLPEGESRTPVDLTVEPLDGQAGLGAPLRAGASVPACAAPGTKRMAGRDYPLLRRHEPYTPARLNCLAGNYLQTLYDPRYHLLAFQPGERMPNHYVHDTSRSLLAIADEARFTPAVRLGLARALLRGLQAACLPGGEYLFAFKHDSRPIEWRRDAPDSGIRLVFRQDELEPVARFGIETVAPGRQGWHGATVRDDTPAEDRGDGARVQWTRAWNHSSPLSCTASMAGSDHGIAPELRIENPDRTALRLVVSGLAEHGNWFTPGSWGPEAVLPGDLGGWTAAECPQAWTPDDDFVLVRGGNSGFNTYCKALLLVWSARPDRIEVERTEGGRFGSLISGLRLVYEKRPESELRLWAMPFNGYPEDLRVPRILARRIHRDGRLGTEPFEPVMTTNAWGIGPGGAAAAAYLLSRYGTETEAREAVEFALAAMRAEVERHRNGVLTPFPFHLIHGCEYLHLMGFDEFDAPAREWAEAILEMRLEDGTWRWLNFQYRCLLGLQHAVAFLDDTERFRTAIAAGLQSIDYGDDGCRWRGELMGEDDFVGALALGVFGHSGDWGKVESALAQRRAYIDDCGFQACSDLNPYMLGWSVAGLGLDAAPKLILELDEFAVYGEGRHPTKTGVPSAYVVNPHHPCCADVRFPPAGWLTPGRD